MEVDLLTLVSLCLTFLLAGVIKGIIGLGLPTVSLAILTIVFDLTTAMALLLIPSFLTNLWQGLAGGSFGELLKRLWPMLLPATLCIWFGSLLLSQIDTAWLSMLLGFLLVLYAAISLSGWRWNISPGRQRSTGVVIGIINGFFTGMTGSFVVPGVMYLQAIQLSRDQLIQAMGILFTLSTLSLAVALQSGGFLNVQLGIYSAIGFLPALTGMLFGQKIRKQLSENLFRQVFFGSLLLLGFYIAYQAV